MTGYVIFNSEAAFDTAHATAKVVAGLPRVGLVNGKPAPENQQTVNITSCHSHPTDGTVVANIDDGWPADLRTGFVYLTEDDVSEYFPNDEE